MMPCSEHRSRKTSPPPDRDNPLCSAAPWVRGSVRHRAKAVRLKVFKDAGLGEPRQRSRGNGNENELEEREELIH